MKRLFLLTCIIIAFVAVLLPFHLFAAATGSCVMSEDATGSASIMKVTWVCTADGSGTFTTITASSPSKGWVYDVETSPGGTAPTASTGFTLTSSGSSKDVMDGACSAVLGSTAGQCVPAKSGWFHGTLRPVLSGSFGANATFTIRAWYWIQK